MVAVKLGAIPPKKEIVLARQRKITVATIRCKLASAVDRRGINSVDHFARRSALGPFAESHEEHIRRPDTGELGLTTAVPRALKAQTVYDATTILTPAASSATLSSRGGSSSVTRTSS